MTSAAEHGGHGRLAGILRKATLRAAPESLSRATLCAGAGVAGDYRGARMKDRQLSVLFAEDWRDALAGIGAEGAHWSMRRANLLIESMKNPKKTGLLLRFGDSALAEIVSECSPCSRMDEALQGLRRALEPGWRGGVLCRVLEGGAIAQGDPVFANDFPGQDSVLRFWLTEVDPKEWYRSHPALDAQIGRCFGAACLLARGGRLDGWRKDARGTLALLLLLDQFPRNVWRGKAAAFASDAKARKTAREAIARGFDLATALPARQFFYLPFMHSEERDDQDYCVAVIRDRSGLPPDSLLHAQAHRTIIHRFGRFPFRNAALRRESSPAERKFLSEGGYAAIVEHHRSG